MKTLEQIEELVHNYGSRCRYEVNDAIPESYMGAIRRTMASKEHLFAARLEYLRGILGEGEE